MAQHAFGQICPASVWINEIAFSVLGDGIDGEIPS